MPKWALSALVALLCLPARAGKFDDEQPQSVLNALKLSGLLDVRGFSTTRRVSWLDGGPNMLRYGGKDTIGNGVGDHSRAGFSIPQASVVLDVDVPMNAKIHVQTNFSTDSSSVSNRVGIVEAYAQADHEFEHDGLGVRAGAFIPLISFEHPDNGWSTRYTLTPSAIGAWVGEDIRVTGAQGSWQHDFPWSIQTRAIGGGFSGGDQIGRLLWFRGFAMDDYQATIGERYLLLGRSYEPDRELDGRLGYFGRGDLFLFDRGFQFGGGYWTNNANNQVGSPVATNPNNIDTQAFKTSLWHYGGKIEYSHFTLIGQLMRVTISTIDKVPTDWSAAYGLASAEFGKLRVSGRYDRFWSVPRQNGHAATGFLAWNFSLRQQVGVEFVYANSRTAQLVRPLPEVDRLWQLNWRLRY